MTFLCWLIPFCLLGIRSLRPLRNRKLMRKSPYPSPCPYSPYHRTIYQAAVFGFFLAMSDSALPPGSELWSGIPQETPGI